MRVVEGSGLQRSAPRSLSPQLVGSAACFVEEVHHLFFQGMGIMQLEAQRLSARGVSLARAWPPDGSVWWRWRHTWSGSDRKRRLPILQRRRRGGRRGSTFRPSGCFCTRPSAISASRLARTSSVSQRRRSASVCAVASGWRQSSSHRRMLRLSAFLLLSFSASLLFSAVRT